MKESPPSSHWSSNANSLVAEIEEGTEGSDSSWVLERVHVCAFRVLHCSLDWVTVMNKDEVEPELGSTSYILRIYFYSTNLDMEDIQVVCGRSETSKSN